MKEGISVLLLYKFHVLQKFDFSTYIVSHIVIQIFIHIVVQIHVFMG